MSDTQAVSAPPVEGTPSLGDTPSRGRAYCGPAHGHSWIVDDAETPPRTVDLGEGRHRVRYRLVHHPRTHRPARDQMGNYVYMPVRHGFDT